jgi:hypothetical protein
MLDLRAWQLGDQLLSLGRRCADDPAPLPDVILGGELAAGLDLGDLGLGGPACLLGEGDAGQATRFAECP